MKVIGLTRIRNESDIIQETLDHMALFCSGGIYVYDDDSTDNTVEICKNHSAVMSVIKGKKWSKNREAAEFINRQEVLELAQKNAQIDDWFVYMDADERIEFNWKDLNNIPDNVVGIKMKLFDYYITESDKNLHYTQRKYIGDEYREILMLFRNTPALKYYLPDQREVFLGYKGKVITQGFVKHYGKAISIQQWEDTCEYYSKNFPKYAEKWDRRRGKAIHSKSDFGRDLIEWEEKEKYGVALWKIELKNKSLPYRGKFYIIKALVSLREKLMRLFFNI